MSDILNHIHPAPGRVVFLEAASGSARTHTLDTFIQRSKLPNSRAWHLEANPPWQGPWSGLRQWLCSLLPDIKRRAPQLLVKHGLELTLAIPELRREIAVATSLLSGRRRSARLLSPPADSASRLAHGLIDLVSACHQLEERGPWVVVIDGFDRASHLVRYFLAELMRRRGGELGLTLLLAVEPGTAKELSCGFSGDVTILRADLPGIPPPLENPLLARVEVARLVTLVGDDATQQEIHGPQIADLWIQSGRPEEALPWLSQALATYVAQGLFDDALPYGLKALQLLDQIRDADIGRRFAITVDLFDIHIAKQQYEDAERIMRLLIGCTEHPWYLFQGYYYLGVLHWSAGDLKEAESSLNLGLAALRQLEFPREKLLLRETLLSSTLAQILCEQGRRAEALLQVQAAKTINDGKLQRTPPAQRSALLFHLATTYGLAGFPGEAVALLTQAIRLTPDQPEYYHDRGRLYRRLKRWSEAYADFKKAAALSPPYAEVWVDLAECCSQLGRCGEAARCYLRALDLDPRYDCEAYDSKKRTTLPSDWAKASSRCVDSPI